MTDTHVTSHNQSGGITAANVHVGPETPATDLFAADQPAPVVSETEFDALIERGTRAQRTSYHKPFLPGMRLLKTVGHYDNGLFGFFTAVPHGRFKRQTGKHRAFKVFDSEEGKWSHLQNLDRFIRMNRAKARKHNRGPSLVHARKAMEIVDSLAIGQMVVFHFWIWRNTLKRVR